MTNQNSKESSGNVFMFLWVPPETKKKFIAKAKSNGNTQSAEARIMINEYLKKK